MEFITSERGGGGRKLAVEGHLYYFQKELADGSWTGTAYCVVGLITAKHALEQPKITLWVVQMSTPIPQIEAEKARSAMKRRAVDTEVSMPINPFLSVLLLGHVVQGRIIPGELLLPWTESLLALISTFHLRRVTVGGTSQTPSDLISRLGDIGHIKCASLIVQWNPLIRYTRGMLLREASPTCRRRLAHNSLASIQWAETFVASVKQMSLQSRRQIQKSPFGHSMLSDLSSHQRIGAVRTGAVGSENWAWSGIFPTGRVFKVSSCDGHIK